MNMVGMGVTIVLILAVGGVGVWYWLRIKETASHEKVEDKDTSEDSSGAEFSAKI